MLCPRGIEAPVLVFGLFLTDVSLENRIRCADSLVLMNDAIDFSLSAFMRCVHLSYGCICLPFVLFGYG